MNLKSKKKKILKHYKRTISIMFDKKEKGYLVLFRNKKELLQAKAEKVSFHAAKGRIERNEKEAIYMAYNVDFEGGLNFAPIAF